jgi:hypothetical protein
VEDGLLAGVQEMRHFVDHAGFQDGYDFQLGGNDGAPGTEPHTVLNAHYLGSLECCSRLRAGLGHEALDTAPVREAFLRTFLSRERGVFLDAPRSVHSSLHANALALYYHLVPEWARASVIELLCQKRLACSPYMAYYLLQALCDAGETQLAFELITCGDTNSWPSMLQAKATAAMEVWTVDQKRNVSFCHAWSSAPVPIIVERVMGLCLKVAERDRIRFNPRPVADLDYAQLELPLGEGIVSVTLSKEGDGVLYELRLPAGVEVQMPADPGLVLLGREPKRGEYRFRRQDGGMA